MPAPMPAPDAARSPVVVPHPASKAAARRKGTPGIPRRRYGPTAAAKICVKTSGATILAIALADIGICAVGTFLGAMAVATRARDLLLPLLFLPLAIPIVIGGVGASVVASPGRYLGFLGIYDLMFALVCWASFEYVVTE